MILNNDAFNDAIDTIDTTDIRYNEEDTPARIIHKLFLEWNQSKNIPFEFMWSRHTWLNYRFLIYFKMLDKTLFLFLEVNHISWS